MSENNRFLEAYGVKVVEHEKLNVPSKPERIKEAAGYVHRNILYSLENLGGGQWALVVSNKDNKEKFERHPLDSKMLGSVLDNLAAVDFDNWNLAKSSMAKLQFKQLGVVEPVAPKEEPKQDEPKEEGSKKKLEAKKKIKESSFKNYKEAADFILDTLAASGWKVKKDLSIPWASSPYVNPNMGKLWFKTQAIYKGQSRPDTSLHVDMKKVAEVMKTNKEKAIAYLEKQLSGQNESTGYEEKKITYNGAIITVWSDDGKMWGIQAFNKKTRKEIFSGGMANFDSYNAALKDAKDGVDEFVADYGSL